MTTEIEAWQHHRAARAVAAHARDAADAAGLLDMLGLTAAEGLDTPAGEPVFVRTPPPRLPVECVSRLNNLLRGPTRREVST